MASTTLFKDWATAANLTYTSPLTSLKDRRIGISAALLLSNLQHAPHAYEPLLPALGGLPFTLETRVRKAVKAFEEVGVEAFVVFDGLKLACQTRGSRFRDAAREAATLDEAWSVYDAGRGDESVAQFGKAASDRAQHISRHLMYLLHDLGVHVFVAPYSADAQLAHWEEVEYVDAVAGTASSLVFGSESILLDFDFENEKFVWLDVKRCLSHFSLSREQFVDVLLLSGSSLLPPVPELEATPLTARMFAARDLLARNGNSGDLAASKDANYSSLYQKARFAIKHAVVITLEGNVEPKQWQNAPADTHEFIGQRLPDELYAYLSRGLIEPRVLDWRTRLEVDETPPLDGGHSPVYQELVQAKLIPLRRQALSLITQRLNRYYQKKDVQMVAWFRENERTELGLTDVTEPSKRADTWHVPAKIVSSAKTSLDGQTSLFSALAIVADDIVAKSTLTRRNKDTSPLREQAELRSNSVWRFLSDRDYIDADHKPSAAGRSLLAASRRASELNIANTETEEAVFLVLELLRLDMLSPETLFQTPIYSGQPSRGSDKDKTHTNLITRIAALLNFNHSPIGFTGPLSRHILAFHQCASTVRSALRDLLEAHAVDMCLSGAVDRSLSITAYTDLAASLPLRNEPSIGCALIVKSYLEELCTSGSAAEKKDVAAAASSDKPESPESKSILDLKKWFVHCTDIEGDLAKTWKVWEVVRVAVDAAVKEKVVGAEKGQWFKEADEWLKGKLKE